MENRECPVDASLAITKVYEKSLAQIKRDLFGRFQYKYGLGPRDILHLAIERLLASANWSKVRDVEGYIEFSIMRNAKQVYLNNKRRNLLSYSSQSEVECWFYPSTEVYSSVRVDLRSMMESMDPIEMAVLLERADGSSTSNIYSKIGISRRRLYESLDFHKSNTAEEVR